MGGIVMYPHEVHGAGAQGGYSALIKFVGRMDIGALADVAVPRLAGVGIYCGKGKNLSAGQFEVQFGSLADGGQRLSQVQRQAQQVLAPSFWNEKAKVSSDSELLVPR